MVNLDCVGKNVAALREKRALTQAMLAVGIGLTPAGVSNIERGESLPSLDALIRIADYFQVSLDSLLSRKNDNKDGVLLEIEIPKQVDMIAGCLLKRDILENMREGSYHRFPQGECYMSSLEKSALLAVQNDSEIQLTEEELGEVCELLKIVLHPNVYNVLKEIERLGEAAVFSKEQLSGSVNLVSEELDKVMGQLEEYGLIEPSGEEGFFEVLNYVLIKIIFVLAKHLAFDL